ncbi:MAG: hypothetical protein HN736_15225 [Anaerolineae bacterium]|nr:hypothetical protein [Anaerolineae bacterium]MBT4310466.1 hypothetical protein [Anaerolineae bacterium]MBT4457755.1 hypothetical protein [Anaerolineae bacterium]MBT6812662.1 hypothetical protein [Anaerolineae bacterium]MBT7015960.1 hypothetical protein [Anaerolineae bacterium]
MPAPLDRLRRNAPSLSLIPLWMNLPNPIQIPSPACGGGARGGGSGWQRHPLLALTYLGAFRLPDASGGSNWEYSGHGLTHRPASEQD